ncbi:MAG: SDR family oxidoreductase, partial [Enterobacterales bacterium]|nr:SDR family oxidoreductase [Enterobacterales bacterium]
MTPWLIFGAGSGVGAELVTLGLREQRPLFALVRNPEQAQALRDKGVQVIEGDALNAEKVKQVCSLAGEHARIVSTLGGREGDYQGNRL